MNIKRRFLRLVDLRVNHYFAGRKSAGTPHLERVHSIESLAHASDFKAGSLLERAGESSLS